MAESEHFHHNMEEKMQQGIIGKKPKMSKTGSCSPMWILKLFM